MARFARIQPHTHTPQSPDNSESTDLTHIPHIASFGFALSVRGVRVLNFVVLAVHVALKKVTAGSGKCEGRFSGN
jgi:hypothetical protein